MRSHYANRLANELYTVVLSSGNLNEEQKRVVRNAATTLMQSQRAGADKEPNIISRGRYWYVKGAKQAFESEHSARKYAARHNGYSKKGESLKSENLDDLLNEIRDPKGKYEKEYQDERAERIGLNLGDMSYETYLSYKAASVYLEQLSKEETADEIP